MVYRKTPGHSNTPKINRPIKSTMTKTHQSMGMVADGYKKLEYTGIMPAMGESIYIEHGLDNSKIIDFSSVVVDSSDTLRLPNVTASTDIEYLLRIKSDGTIWLTTGTSGTLIAGRPYKVLVTYKK